MSGWLSFLFGGLLAFLMLLFIADQWAWGKKLGFNEAVVICRQDLSKCVERQ